MANEVASGVTGRRKTTKRKSFHGTLHIPAGKDVSDEIMRAYGNESRSDGLDEEELKAMTVTLSAKRKLK